MKLRNFLIAVATVSFLFIGINLISAQEGDKEEAAPVQETTTEAPAAQSGTETQAPEVTIQPPMVSAPVETKAPVQEVKNEAPEMESKAEAKAPEAAKSEAEPQWVWGEVSAVDVPSKTVTVKYLDYETDQQKELSATLDDKTAYEAVDSIEEIKVGDSLSVDYMTGADGKNTAIRISLERPEAAPAPQEGDNTTTTPQDMQPQSTPPSDY